MDHGVELPLGGIPPAHILDHNGVAGLHGAQDVERIAVYYSVFLVIGCAREEHWRGRCPVEPIHVGRQPHPITHRHHDVLVNQNGCH